MTASPCTLPARAESRLVRMLRCAGAWLIAGQRAGFVSAHAADAQLLAAFEQARREGLPPHPLPDDVRDAYRLWFGADLNKWL